MRILYIAQPHIENEFVIFPGQGSFYATATIMTAYDDMLHLQVVHCIIEHTEQVHIRIDHQVRHIAVHEDLPGWVPVISLAGTRLSLQQSIEFGGL